MSFYISSVSGLEWSLDKGKNTDLEYFDYVLNS